MLIVISSLRTCDKNKLCFVLGQFCHRVRRHGSQHGGCQVLQAGKKTDFKLSEAACYRRCWRQASLFGCLLRIRILDLITKSEIIFFDVYSSFNHLLFAMQKNGQKTFFRHG